MGHGRSPAAAGQPAARGYGQLAALLAEAVQDAGAGDHAATAARAAGERAHRPGGWLDNLRARGYEPYGRTTRRRFRSGLFAVVTG